MSSRGLLVFVIIAIARVAMAAKTQAPPDDQEMTTGDGCRIRPANDCVGVSVDCSNLHLDHIPDNLPIDTRELVLRHNNISRVNDFSLEKYTELTTLDLSRNNLRTLGMHAFFGLSRLLQLDLTYNKLCLNNITYPYGLFRRMTSLQRLTMTSNICETQHSEYPDKTLVHLSNLKYLSLTGIPTAQLGRGFGRLTNLKTLLFAGHGCSMPVLNDATFQSLRNVNLSHLCIKTCRLRTMHPGSLKPLSHLKTLNLACNQLVGFQAIHAAIVAAKGMRLKTLVVDDVNPSGWILDREHFAHIAMNSIERLSMRANDIIDIEISLFRPLKRLHYINLGYNNVFKILPEVDRTKSVLDLLFSLNLDVIDVSNYSSERDTFRHCFCNREAISSDEDPYDPTKYFFRPIPPYVDLDYSRPPPPKKTCHAGRTHKEQMQCHTIPPSAQVIYADNLVLNPKKILHRELAINVSAENDVVVLNLSHNPEYSIISHVRGLRRCQVMDISSCSISTIRMGALSGIPMLKYFYMSDNRIGENNFDLRNVFDDLSSLEVLDLSRNVISQIHVSAFSSLRNLRNLMLSGNRLVSVHFDISRLHKLTTINLTHNRIARFNVTAPATGSSDSGCLYVDLSWNPLHEQNPFRCSKADVEPARCNTVRPTSTALSTSGENGSTTAYSLSNTGVTPSHKEGKPSDNHKLVICLIIFFVVVILVVFIVVVVINRDRCTSMYNRLRTVLAYIHYDPIVDDSYPIVDVLVTEE